METLDIFLAFVVALAWYMGYRTGQHITAARITRLLLDDENKIHELVSQARKTMSKLDDGGTEVAQELEVERHGDQLYVYTKSEGEFLAQGSTLQECLAIIEQRFPDRNFQGLLTKEQADQLGISVK